MAFFFQLLVVISLMSKKTGHESSEEQHIGFQIWWCHLLSLAYCNAPQLQKTLLKELARRVLADIFDSEKKK